MFRLPRLRLVIRVEQPQHGIFQAQRTPLVIRQVGVDPVCIGLQHCLEIRIRRGCLLLRRAGKAHGAQKGIGLQLALAEHLREPPGADMPREIHLPEAFLSVHIALGEEKIMRRLGVNMRHAVDIAIHIHRCIQRCQAYLSLHLWKRAPHRINPKSPA